MSPRRLAPIFAALLLAVLLVPGEAEERPPNPHGTDRCTDCHMDVSLGSQALVKGAPDELCDSCHPGDDLHEVGIPVVETNPREDMLLWEDLVSCISCHDEPACDGKPVDPADPYFYRGGPVGDVSDLCFRCHNEEEMTRFNPHTSAFLEDGSINPDTCDYCHVDVPDPHLAKSIDDIQLRVGSINVCRGCHLGVPHAGSEVHLTTPSEEMLARMEAMTKHTGVPIVLDPHGKIFCETCHNPHPPGVLEEPPAYKGYGQIEGQPVTPLAFFDTVTVPETGRRNEELAATTGAADTLVLNNEEPGFMRLPLHNGDLCNACHDLQTIGGAE